MVMYRVNAHCHTTIKIFTQGWVQKLTRHMFHNIFNKRILLKCMQKCQKQQFSMKIIIISDFYKLRYLYEKMPNLAMWKQPCKQYDLPPHL